MAGKSVSPQLKSVCSLAGLTAAAVLLVACSGDNDPNKVAGRRPPAATSVVVAAVEQRPVPLEIRAIGNVEAYSVVEVKSQITGPIAKVLFEEGQDVKQGQVLFEIDPRPFDQSIREMQAEVANRKAALAQAEANAARDQAQAKNAKTQAERYAELTAQGIISKDQNEQFQIQALVAEKAVAASTANIESARAAILGAESKLEDARLQRTYATIRAPISGRAGKLTRKVGNLVGANESTPLVTINEVTPVYATFTVPEQSLNDLRRFSANGKLRVQAQSQGDPAAAPAEGVLDFVDNTVDTASGTILLKATFANKDRRLWPGQFVNVGVRLSNPTEVVIPTSAVRMAQQGSYVFVVKADSTAEQRVIQTARAFGDLTVVQDGVEPGERVVIEGQLRVRPGAKVMVAGEGAQAKAPTKVASSAAGEKD